MPEQSAAFADTLNVAGGDRQNVGDASGEVNPHSFLCIYNMYIGLPIALTARFSL